MLDFPRASMTVTQCSAAPLAALRLAEAVSGNLYVDRMDRQRAERVVRLFESRGELDQLLTFDESVVWACLERARARLRAATVLLDAEYWESAYTEAYDAYRTSAEAIVLRLGWRVPAVAGAHRITADIAHAAVQHVTEAFAPATAEQFRQGRHESEYFDPERPVDKTKEDAHWALAHAQAAVSAVEDALSDL